MKPPTAKQRVGEFWDEAACGEVYAQGDDPCKRLDAQAITRYHLEPYIAEFAGFGDGKGRVVLEVGVGMGADHLEWARVGPARLAGIDLTPRAIELTRQRLRCHGLTSETQVADAEALPFDADSFDIVYSWGVLHHSPDTPRAVDEVHRVLKPGGSARIMIYNRRSIVGYMLWLRYALLAGRPGRDLDEIYSDHLESPGTKAYSEQGARRLFARFSVVEVQYRLSIGDLLEGEAGQRHHGLLLSAARAVWPRWLIRRWLTRRGLFLLVTATK